MCGGVSPAAGPRGTPRAPLCTAWGAQWHISPGQRLASGRHGSCAGTGFVARAGAWAGASLQGLEMAPVLVLALDHLMHWTCSERHLEGRRINQSAIARAYDTGAWFTRGHSIPKNLQ